jgi:molecular chaperone GrpE (heat shock protein)
LVEQLVRHEASRGQQLRRANQRLENNTDELIPLRDWVRMMATTEHEVTRELFCKQFRNLYRKLGQILEKRGMELLEEQAAFDCRTQRVVGTVPAERPEQVDQVQDTVVPGYRLDGALVRPQHVVVFTKSEEPVARFT